jgi:hypothetical protein
MAAPAAQPRGLAVDPPVREYFPNVVMPVRQAVLGRLRHAAQLCPDLHGPAAGARPRRSQVLGRFDHQQLTTNLNPCSRARWSALQGRSVVRSRRLWCSLLRGDSIWTAEGASPCQSREVAVRGSTFEVSGARSSASARCRVCVMDLGSRGCVCECVCDGSAWVCV